MKIKTTGGRRMNQELFTVEEENLICAFFAGGRAALIAELRAAMPDFDEPEMREIAQTALKKLDALTDAEFDAHIFSPAYDEDETEV